MATTTLPLSTSIHSTTTRHRIGWLAVSLSACLAVTVTQMYVGFCWAFMAVIVGLLAWAVITSSGEVPLKIMVAYIGWWCISAVAVAYLQYIDRLWPMKFDPSAARADQYFGVPIALLCARLYSGFRAVSIPTNILYWMMPYMLVLQYGWHLTDHRGRPNRLLLAYGTALLVGPALYNIAPTCGPMFAFAGYPAAAPVVQGGTVLLSGYANCLPSLHLTLALVFLWLRPAGKFILTVNILFVAATAFATLATGQHYFVDLVAALFFSAFVACVANRRLADATASLLVTVAICLTVSML